MEVKHSEPITYRLYDELKNHIGESNAISAKELSAKFGICERTLREHINTIRNSAELEKIIGSSNNGYFICTAEEFKQTNNRLLSTAVNLLKTVKANERKAGLDGQMKMQLGKHYKEVFQAFGESN